MIAALPQIGGSHWPWVLAALAVLVMLWALAEKIARHRARRRRKQRAKAKDYGRLSDANLAREIKSLKAEKRDAEQAVLAREPGAAEAAQIISARLADAEDERFRRDALGKG